MYKLDPNTWDEYCPGISKNIYEKCTDSSTFASCCQSKCSEYQMSASDRCKKTTCSNCDDIPRCHHTISFNLYDL